MATSVRGVKWENWKKVSIILGGYDVTIDEYFKRFLYFLYVSEHHVALCIYFIMLNS